MCAIILLLLGAESSGICTAERLVSRTGKCARPTNSPRVKRQLPVLFAHADGGPRLELAAEEGVGQGVLEAVLDDAAEGARAVDRVEALVGQQHSHRVRDLQRKAVRCHLGDELGQLQVDDHADVVPVDSGSGGMAESIDISIELLTLRDEADNLTSTA